MRGKYFKKIILISNFYLVLRERSYLETIAKFRLLKQRSDLPATMDSIMNNIHYILGRYFYIIRINRRKIKFWGWNI